MCVQVLSRMLCVRVVLYVEVWKRVCVKWPARKLTYVKAKAGDTDKKHKHEEIRWSLSCSSLAVRCVGVSAFRFPIVNILCLIAITITYCTIHHHACTRALVWHGLIWRANVGTCNVSVSREWDGHGRSVGQSVGRSVGQSVSRLVNARVPIDHASVGLAQACTNYSWLSTPLWQLASCMIISTCTPLPGVRSLPKLMHSLGTKMTPQQQWCFRLPANLREEGWQSLIRGGRGQNQSTI